MLMRTFIAIHRDGERLYTTAANHMHTTTAQAALVCPFKCRDIQAGDKRIVMMVRRFSDIDIRYRYPLHLPRAREHELTHLWNFA